MGRDLRAGEAGVSNMAEGRGAGVPLEGEREWGGGTVSRIEEQLVLPIQDAITIVIRIKQVADQVVVEIGGRARRVARVGAIQGLVIISIAIAIAIGQLRVGAGQ